MKIKLLFTIVFIYSNALFSQTINTTKSDTDLIKHQVGIGISKFVNSAFSSDLYAYGIEYRYKYSSKIHFRSGINYSKDDSNGGYIDGGIKIGIDKNIRKYEKWNFYIGIDFLSNYSNYKNINKDNYNLGIAPLLGVQFCVSKNFSLSIEPSLFIIRKIVIDRSTFEKNNVTQWTESGLGKLGYIQLNFHF